MKYYMWTFVCLISQTLWAQVRLEQCYDSARINYPVVQKLDLLERTKDFSVEQVKKTFLPQLTFSGRVSWQSDVTEIPFHIPGMEIKGMEQDQYQLVLELKQLVYDGGRVKAQRNLQESRIYAEKQKTEIDFYMLQQRIDDLYFAILLQSSQLKQFGLLEEQLNQNRNQVKSGVRHGILCEADLDALDVELLALKQKKASVNASREAYAEVLSLLTGIRNIHPESLVIPTVPAEHRRYLRPELSYMDAQIQHLKAQQKVTLASLRPTLGIFMQGGYGDPGLNMLEGGFKPYYIGGIQLTWNISNLYTQKNERRIIDKQMEMLELDRKTFNLNHRTEKVMLEHNIRNKKKEIEQDEEIIIRRERIRKAAETRVSQGTMPVLEFLRTILDEDRARQEKMTHELELHQAYYRLFRLGDLEY